MDKSLLGKAVSATEEPTPGWMFHQIAKWTRDFSACQQLEDYLLKQLKSSSNPHTLRKTLIIIKNVAQQGDTQFSLNISRKSEEIKKFAAFKGPQDPMHGDNLNLQIRNAASQAMETIFQRTESRGTTGFYGNNHFQPAEQMVGIQNPHIGTMPPKDPMANSYTGFGGPTAPVSSTGKFVGIGNPQYATPSSQTPANAATGDQTWTQWTVSKLSSALSRTPTKPYDGLDPDKNTNFINTDTTGTYAPVQIGAVQVGTSNPYTFNQQAVPNGSDDWEIQQQPSASNGAHETKIVDEFTTASAVKAAPSRQELSQFCTRCQTVSSELIAEKLDDKLLATAWQAKLRALFAIEALIKAKNTAVLEYFTSKYDNIQAQTVAVHETLAQKAQKVINLIIKSDMPMTETSKQKTKKPTMKPVPKQSPQKSMSDLLPFDDLTSFSSESNGKNTGSNTMTDMFGGMSVADNSVDETDLEKIIASAPQSQLTRETRKRGDSSSIISMFQNTSVQPVVPIVAARGNVVPIYIAVPQPMMTVPMTTGTRSTAAQPFASSLQPQTKSSSTGFDFIKEPSTETTKDSFDFVKSEFLLK